MKWMTRISASFVLLIIPTVIWAAEPLESWNDGHAKRSILEFVQRVTDADSPDFVPAEQRIAVFDNDGTLWCEAPLPLQLAFALDELKRRVPDEPKLAADPMVQAALAGDFGKLIQGEHHEGLIRIISLTHSGMTTDEFSASVRRWAASYRHPKFDQSLAGMTYQPMLELLQMLRENNFKTYIVSGGGTDFMRAISAQLYGIPPEQVIGSHGQTQFEIRAGKPVLTKTLKELFVDDKEAKPVAIHRFIGRRPIACFGNSNGDQAMLQYTTMANPLPSFGLLVHHTDEVREYAYDVKPPSSGTLTTALEIADEQGWTVVDMKTDWKRVFRAAD